MTVARSLQLQSWPTFARTASMSTLFPIKARLALGLCCVLAACSGANTSPATQAANTADTRPPPAPENIETDLHLARFGDRAAPPLVFLHGGPGGNSYLFEATAGEPLGRSFHVLSYDRRGTGRSPDGTAADFSFARATEDLHQLVSALPSPPVLVGFSFGGAVALHYLEAHPDAVQAAVLVGAPISFPRALDNIASRCRAVYQAKNDTENLGYLDQLAALPPGSPQHVAFTFMHAIGCGLYVPKAQTDAAQALYRAAMAKDERRMISNARQEPTQGFIANENYALLDMSALVERHKQRLFAIVGAEDSLVSQTDIDFLRATLAPGRVQVIEGAAHNVFVDQQPAFLDAMRSSVAGRPVP